ncbi:hypothetical protein [Psychroflexus gondwanensis]|jgi:type I restriction enzyme R subunit|uniref:hypothetical protein n=1 Tax=Psychroflexus gondwanensis TaxID=251 RepID=UPI0016802E96|nr:hypothetical protein [Psychroflexus gondwanensis]
MCLPIWKAETQKTLQELSKTETLDQNRVEDIINEYLFKGRIANEDGMKIGLLKP